MSIAAAQLSVDTLPNVASLHCVVQDGELGSGIPSFLIPFRILLSYTRYFEHHTTRSYKWKVVL